MTGRVDILGVFLKKCKKVKNEVTRTEKHCFWLIYPKTFNKFTFLGPVTSILTFLQFLKNTPVISTNFVRKKYKSYNQENLKNSI